MNRTMTEGLPTGVTVLATASVAAGGVDVRYEVENDTAERIFVHDLVTDASHAPLPGRAYVQFRTADRALHLLLGTPPMPRLRYSPYAPIAPLARGVPAGSSIEGSLRLTIPVEEWQPYPLEGDEPVGAERARVRPNGSGTSPAASDHGRATDAADMPSADDEPPKSDQLILTLEFTVEKDIDTYSRPDNAPTGYYRIVGWPNHRAEAVVPLPEPVPVVLGPKGLPEF